MRDFHEFHDSRFDADVQFAYDFIKDMGSPADPTPPHKMTVVAAERADEFRDHYNNDFLYHFSDTFRKRNTLIHSSGRYHSDHPICGINRHSIFVIDKSEPEKPLESWLSRVSTTVHEATHSVTSTKRLAHRYYRELLAGFGEQAFLQHIDQLGIRQIPQDSAIKVKDLLSDTTHEIAVPGQIRTTHKREDTPDGTGKNIRASAGSISAYVLLDTMRKLGNPLDPQTLIQVSHPNNTKGITLIKQALRTINPKIPKIIENDIPQTSVGCMYVSHLIIENVKDSRR